MQFNPHLENCDRHLSLVTPEYINIKDHPFKITIIIQNLFQKVSILIIVVFVCFKQNLTFLSLLLNVVRKIKRQILQDVLDKMVMSCFSLQRPK